MKLTPIRTASGAATSEGLKRRLNEDSFVAQAPLFLVADGMGGYESGEVASAAVIGQFSAHAGVPSLSPAQMRVLYDAACSAVTQLPEGAGAGAGTTLTGVAVSESGGDGYWLVINVGDSRTYRYAGGKLEQISVDHSVVQELVEDGELTSSEASTDSRRNVITRAIGAGGASEPDIWMLPAAEGDRILVCSDGLTGELDDARIAEVLGAGAEPQDTATQLVHEAMLHGGRDNITALVVDALAVERASQPSADAFEDTVPRDQMERQS